MTRRHRVRLRALALVCAIAAIALLAFADRSDRSAAASPVDADAAARTPLWSPRRAPSVFADAAAQAALQRGVQSVVAGQPSCAVVTTSTGAPLARAGVTTGLAGASNEKLLTAAAALQVLGPDRRLTTRVVTAAPIVDGVVHGDLVVVGGGDPLLVTPAQALARAQDLRYRGTPVTQLASLADALVAAGVRHVDGALVADDSLFDTNRFVPSWKPNYVHDGEVGPIGALTVDGGFADPNGPTAAPDPALLTAQRLQELLAARGVTVASSPQRGTATSAMREVTSISSPPVSALVEEMLTSSDNYTAEMLLREVGVVGAHDGSTTAGASVVVRTLARLGIPTADLQIYDGSGLSPADRLTCNTLLSILGLSTRAPFTAIDRGLPVAGRTGTLVARHLADPLTGVLRAKTGSLDGVSALTGIVDDAQHLRFAFVANGLFTDAGGVLLQDEIASTVAQYPAPSATANLVPAPVRP